MAIFIPPEEYGGGSPVEQDDLAEQIAHARGWDVAVRYHEFKAKPSFRPIAARLRRISADAILEKAKEVLGSVVHPVSPGQAPWTELPPQAENIDIDLEETLEASPVIKTMHAQDLWMSYEMPKRHSVILSVDTSLSMTGEKLALTAVALAVVLFQFPEDLVGIVAFENEARIIKRPKERLAVREVIERFLDVPAQGYTHLEEGLLVALKLVRGAAGRSRVRPPSTVLLTDGKYTAGRDPAYLASRFPHLVVLKMGAEKASHELCLELARKGHGALREVGQLEALPQIMYGVVKDVLRGRSSA